MREPSDSEGSSILVSIDETLTHWFSRSMIHTFTHSNVYPQSDYDDTPRINIHKVTEVS